MRIPKKVYNSTHLTPQERFHLLLKSSGRNDTIEFERLLRTTPQKTYNTQDRNVLGKLESAERIATCFVIMALEYSRHIGIIYLEGSRINTDVLSQAIAELQYYKSLKTTLDHFCEEMGISPIDLVSLHPNGVREYNRIASFQSHNDAIEINEELYTSLCSTLKNS